MPRLFVALRPPAHVREALLEAMGDDGPGTRWQDEDQLHLTLAFLGEVEARRCEDLHEALSAIDVPPFELMVRGVGHFERKGAPSALWAGIAPSEALERLQRRVVAACRRAGAEPDRRAFRPHVTLARLNRSSASPVPWLAAHGTLAAGPWEVGEYRLYESRLSPGGSEYDVLACYRLLHLT